MVIFSIQHQIFFCGCGKKRFLVALCSLLVSLPNLASSKKDFGTLGCLWILICPLKNQYGFCYIEKQPGDFVQFAPCSDCGEHSITSVWNTSVLCRLEVPVADILVRRGLIKCARSIGRCFENLRNILLYVLELVCIDSKFMPTTNAGRAENKQTSQSCLIPAV